jgi:signal transduction histidine kinase
MTESDERISRLVHDLRTPLTIVQGFADLLVRPGVTLTDEERAEYLARIAAGAREMRALLDAARD